MGGHRSRCQAAAAGRVRRRAGDQCQGWDGQRCGHSTFLAWHANSRVEATLLPALLRLVDGGWWKSIAQLQGWVHVGVNRKCDSLRVQTNATRDHRQISLPHCVSATDDVTGLRAPLPSPPPLLHYAVFVICFFVDSSDQVRPRQSPQSSPNPSSTRLLVTPRLNQLIPA
ncbi:hypothetical protein NQZ68_025810 [Dissostichus eleginoides]|nr:hypothetical protein NQZ68_025810 [Dissostichus eleginoides]